MATTRRKLLTDSARFSAATLALGARRLSTAATPGEALGIQLYSVGQALHADVLGTLQRLRAIGFTEVEPAGFAGLSAVEFRKRLDDADLVAPSAHLVLEEGSLDAAFADAHALGARYAVSSMLRPGTGAPLFDLESPVRPGDARSARAPPRAMTLEDAKRTADLANRVGERAKRAGLQYAYHNHDFELTREDGVLAYDELLRGTHGELVKFEVDCGWMAAAGQNAAAYFERHPGRFPLLHAKDFEPVPAELRGKPGPRVGAELGRGTIDYAPIFAAANANGLEHFFAEQEGPFTRLSELEAAEVAYRYLRRVNR
jgi:sugar phosphate isomerase/epimerase